ncbi:MAG: hypothetical protein BWY63_00718 [Chloroflexi bacterium ADurb.Bin360]|nr:MAG: hypothetical protein BWY63_00718 [Chloroflexi bacterium ADurb.Bin360]
MPDLVTQESQVERGIGFDIGVAKLDRQSDVRTLTLPADAGRISVIADSDSQIEAMQGRGFERPGQLMPHQVCHLSSQYLVTHAAPPIWKPLPAKTLATASAATTSSARRRAWYSLNRSSADRARVNCWYSRGRGSSPVS